MPDDVSALFDNPLHSPVQVKIHKEVFKVVYVGLGDIGEINITITTRTFSR